MSNSGNDRSILQYLNNDLERWCHPDIFGCCEARFDKTVNAGNNDASSHPDEDCSCQFDNDDDNDDDDDTKSDFQTSLLDGVNHIASSA